MSGHPPMWFAPDYDEELIGAAEAAGVYAFGHPVRGSGWRADCEKCVASKFTCDAHFVADADLERPCTDCGGTGVTFQTERRCSCQLPDGLRDHDGQIQFQCRVCEHWTEWPVDVADFDPDAHENMCGGSPRCCP